MKSYKNIVFDMGNVLLDFSPHTIVAKFIQDPIRIQSLVNEIFYKQEWLDLDQGLINEDEAFRSIIKRMEPRDHELVRLILDQWHHYLYERVEMIQLLDQLSQMGYHLYLFSNASLRFYHYYNSFQFSSYFEKWVISADLKQSKPSCEFYEMAAKICEIELHESFFIDDSYLNIIQANRMGMEGYVYNGTYRMFIEYLHQLKILH